MLFTIHIEKTQNFQRIPMKQSFVTTKNDVALHFALNQVLFLCFLIEGSILHMF